jgi:hypothetical protein
MAESLVPESFSADDEPLIPFSAAYLMDLLTPLRTAPSIAAMRAQVAQLAELINVAMEGQTEPSTDSVGMTAAYLRQELEQIAQALTLERSIYYVDRLAKSIGEVRTNAINEINLNRWKEYEEVLTDSLWRIERRDGTGVHSANYWGNFIPQIPYQMMRRYTKKNDWVLDTFAGSGTSLVEGQRLGRNTIGIELQQPMVAYARNLVAAEPNPYHVVSDVVQGDSTNSDYQAILARYGQTSVQLALLHPPYFDIIRFSDDPRDLSNSASIEQFLEQIGQIVDRVSTVLERGRYLVLVIGDKYAKGDWIPLGFSTMNTVMQRGYSLKSIVVKNFEETSGKRAQKELWRYRALVGGFYVFKHEYLFVFRKQ